MSYEHRSGSFAWRAASFRDAAEYSRAFSEEERNEIIAAVKSGGRPELDLRAACDELRAGRGFVLLRGLPVGELGLREFTAAVWGVGQHFGQALSQNAQGELITEVIDATAEDPTPRMYRSNLELRPHTDVTAMIALACWQPSQAGGRDASGERRDGSRRDPRARAAAAGAALSRLSLSPPGRTGTG